MDINDILNPNQISPNPEVLEDVDYATSAGWSCPKVKHIIHPQFSVRPVRTMWDGDAHVLKNDRFCGELIDARKSAYISTPLLPTQFSHR